MKLCFGFLLFLPSFSWALLSCNSSKDPEIKLFSHFFSFLIKPEHQERWKTRFELEVDSFAKQSRGTLKKRIKRSKQVINSVVMKQYFNKQFYHLGFCCSELIQMKKNCPFKLCSLRLIEAGLKNYRKFQSE